MECTVDGDTNQRTKYHLSDITIPIKPVASTFRLVRLG